MSDEQIPAPHSQSSTVPPEQPTPPPADPAPTGEPSAVDYKALYEQTQTRLTTAEQTARDHADKAAKYDDHQAAQLSDTEKAVARAEAAEQQVTTLRRLAVDAEIRAAAAGWADPTDAPRYLDDRDKYVTPDGVIDTAAITTDLAAVLLARPHLARTDTPGVRRPAPDLSQGARTNGPAGIDTQIAEAEKNGDWATAISLKNQRLAQQASQQR
ncbi:hypothetical protein JOF56_000868 [Kibdelosporangium banguiense]|uniref:Scaffolding protein n=1 Tax=Kibdelosporangium banguiense TaxID=1365924 RepID=A0ABS4T9F1_9PSEU|nr:hypothetical protein [Kibdelosporangium banguiense]MBP2320483.1 hypothetical protein [Kibdelosporangium banguiense]